MPKNALLKQYAKLFELDGVKFSYDNSALKKLAKLAIKRKTGARGLRAMLEKILLDIMYEIPDEKINSFKLTEKFISTKIHIDNDEKSSSIIKKKAS